MPNASGEILNQVRSHLLIDFHTGFTFQTWRLLPGYDEVVHPNTACSGTYSSKTEKKDSSDYHSPPALQPCPRGFVWLLGLLFLTFALNKCLFIVPARLLCICLWFEPSSFCCHDSSAPTEIQRIKLMRRKTYNHLFHLYLFRVFCFTESSLLLSTSKILTQLQTPTGLSSCHFQTLLWVRASGWRGRT